MLSIRSVRVLLGGLALMLGSFLAPSAQAAVVTNHSGTICKNYNAADVGRLDYFSYGARVIGTGSAAVICPLTRGSQNTNGAWVYVDVQHVGNQTTSCTAYSYNYNGALLGSFSQTLTFSGFQEFALNVTGAGKSGSWSDYAVFCTVPGTGAGIVMGVDVNEQ